MSYCLQELLFAVPVGAFELDPLVLEPLRALDVANQAVIILEHKEFFGIDHERGDHNISGAVLSAAYLVMAVVPFDEFYRKDFRGVIVPIEHVVHRLNQLLIRMRGFISLVPHSDEFERQFTIKALVDVHADQFRHAVGASTGRRPLQGPFYRIPGLCLRLNDRQGIGWLYRHANRRLVHIDVWIV